MDTSSCTKRGFRTPASFLWRSLKQAKPEVVLSIRTHLGSWLALLPLRSSPPRAALPVGHKGAVMNIMIFIAVSPRAQGTEVGALCCAHWRMLPAPESSQPMERRRKRIKSSSKCGKGEKRGTAQPLRDRRWVHCAHPRQGEMKFQPVQPPPSNSPSKSMLRQHHVWMWKHTQEEKEEALTFTTLWDYVGFCNIILREQTRAEIGDSNQLWGDLA